MSEIMVVIPTYNEVENLPAMVAELFDLDVEGLGILVIDDASPDGTGAVADELVERYPGLFHVIHRQGKLGLGTAYIEGYKWALGHGADVIIQMDADFSHSPKYVPELINNLANADVVIGSRYIKGGRLDERWGIGRRFLSWWANSIWVRTILGMNIRDATAGFKCWRRRSLEAIDLDKIRSNGYIFQVEMSYVAEKLGLRVKEIPICFEDRQIGNSKMSTRVQLEAALRVFEIRWRYRGIGLMVRPFKTEKS
jgi:dolichol-phosphate mannosyltransferase